MNLEGAQEMFSTPLVDKTVDSDLFANLLSDAAAPEATFDYAPRKLTQRVHDQTRNGVLEDTLSWAQDRARSSVRCIFGHRGAGKSSLAETIAHKLLRRKQPVVTFFFSRSGANTKHIGKVIPTLTSSLAYQGQVYKDYILSAFKRDPEILTKSIEVQWQLVRDTLQQPALSSLPLTIFILDGLDQCENKDELLLLIKLILTNIPSSAKIILCSRPIPHLRDFLPPFKLGSDSLISMGDSQQDRHGIAMYFQSSFKHIAQLRHLYRGEDAASCPSADIQENLVDTACGQFVFATAVINFVRDNCGILLRRLETVIAGRSNASHTVDRHHLDNMQDLVTNTPFQHFQLLDKIITFLALHHSHPTPPLSLSVISAFWAVQPSTVESILELVQSEVAITEDIVQFRHQSFISFLLSPSFPHPYQKRARDFTQIAIRSFRIMKRGLIEIAHSQWFYQCGASLPTPELLLCIDDLDKDRWLRWVMTQPWRLIDPGYAHFISWLDSQYFLGRLKLKFPALLLVDARRKWLQQHSNIVIRELVNRDLRALYNRGDISTKECILLLNVIHEQLLTASDVLDKFGPHSTDNRVVLREMLAYESSRADSRMPERWMPPEDQPWEMLTESFTSIQSLPSQLAQPLAFYLGFIYHYIRFHFSDYEPLMTRRCKALRPYTIPMLITIIAFCLALDSMFIRALFLIFAALIYLSMIF